MPSLPVIAGAFRCTLNWAGGSSGNQSHNVIHVLSPTATVTQIVAALATAINANPATFSMMDSPVALESVSVLPLDGSSGTSVLAPPVTVNVSTGTGNLVPEAAIGVTFYTGLSGPRHRGRIFIGPLTEDNIANGLYVPTLATVTNAWNSFLTSLRTALPGSVGGLGVASYVHADINAVTLCSAHADLRTQVRRLRRLRP